jgi:hypothetical protein
MANSLRQLVTPCLITRIPGHGHGTPSNSLHPEGLLQNMLMLYSESVE